MTNHLNKLEQMTKDNAQREASLRGPWQAYANKRPLSIQDCKHERFNGGTLQICESGCGHPRLHIQGYLAGLAANAERVKELSQVIDWYLALYNEVQSVSPEFFQLCADRNAVEYLASEAAAIKAALGGTNES